MPSLRDMFTAKTQAAEAEKAAAERAKKERTEAHEAQRADAGLEKIAEKLRKDIEDRIRKNNSDKIIVYDMNISSYWVDLATLEALDGFKHLSAICADPAVDVGIKIYKYDYWQIRVDLQQPYTGPFKQPAPEKKSPAAKTPADNAAAEPALDNAVLEMSKAALQKLLVRIKKERPDDFAAVADAGRNYTGLTRDIKPPQPSRIPHP